MAAGPPRTSSHVDAGSGEQRPFVGGEETSPFVRAAVAVDNANGSIPNGTTIGLPYINADLTMTIAWLPTGDWIGLILVSRAIADGVSTGVVDLHDAQQGSFGQVAMIVARRRAHHPLRRLTAATPSSGP